jgi:HAMP domain-containing protein
MNTDGPRRSVRRIGRVATYAMPKELTMKFLRFGLKTRIYAGFATLALLGLVLAAYATWELSSIKGDVERSSGLIDNTTRMLGAADQIEIIRRANLRYNVDADEESTKEAAQAEATAIELLKAASAEALSEERRVIYNSVAADVETLRGKRETLKTFGRQMHDDRAKLFAVGEELGADTQKLMEARSSIPNREVAALVIPVESSVLITRVSNWRFLATRDEKGPAVFKTNAEHAIAAISALEKAELPDNVRALIGPVKATFASYIASFNSLSANMLKSDDLYWKTMVPLSIDMLERAGKAAASLKQSSDTTKTQSIERIGATIFAQEGVAGLALVLGILIAFFVGRSIIKPVVGMTGAMGRLAAGDNAVEIPSRDSTDEIGAMAKAVEVFKQNAIERIKLQAEQREAEARAASDKRTAEEREAAEKQARQRIRSGRGRHHQHGIVRRERTRSGGQHVDQDRRYHPAALDRGRIGIGRGLRQRPVGRLLHRRDDLLGAGDRQAGSGIEPDRQRGRQPGGAYRPAHQ